MTATTVSPLRFRRGALTRTQRLSHSRTAVGPLVDLTGTGLVTTVELFKVYPGLKVQDIKVNISIAATSTGTMGIVVGDSDDTDRFFTSDIFLEAIGTKSANKNLGFTYQSSDPTVITATATATGTGAHFDTGTFQAVLTYVEDDY